VTPHPFSRKNRINKDLGLVLLYSDNVQIPEYLTSVPLPLAASIMAGVPRSLPADRDIHSPSMLEVVFP